MKTLTAPIGFLGVFCPLKSDTQPFYPSHAVVLTLILVESMTISGPKIVASMVVEDLFTQSNCDSILFDLAESTCILVTNQVGSGSSLS